MLPRHLLEFPVHNDAHSEGLRSRMLGWRQEGRKGLSPVLAASRRAVNRAGSSALPSPPSSCVTLFGLLLWTGLRVSEALRLTHDAVDLNTGILTVHENKYNKSRKVPLHRSAIEALRHYSEQRDRHFVLHRSEAFFLAKHDTALDYRRVLRTYRVPDIA